jgi:azurin
LNNRFKFQRLWIIKSIQMKFRLLQIALLLGLPFGSWAQRNCGSVEHHQHLIQTHPEIENNRRQIEENTQRFEKQQSADKVTGIVYTIPVVVHVVYRTAAENISDAQVLSQIAVLNEDYRLLNTDNVNTPALFAGLKADAEIQFCLAKQDPTGAATTGITRTLTTRTTFGTNDAVKSAATNGKAAWNTGAYLNIWVCNLQGTALGYSTIPGSAPDKDGVVMDGSTAGAASNYLKAKDARVVAGSTVIGGGESTSVKFAVSKISAKDKYVFFCTFPGHAAIMKGLVNLV